LSLLIPENLVYTTHNVRFSFYW